MIITNQSRNEKEEKENDFKRLKIVENCQKLDSFEANPKKDFKSLNCIKCMQCQAEDISIKL